MLSCIRQQHTIHMIPKLTARKSVLPNFGPARLKLEYRNDTYEPGKSPDGPANNGFSFTQRREVFLRVKIQIVSPVAAGQANSEALPWGVKNFVLTQRVDEPFLVRLQTSPPTSCRWDDDWQATGTPFLVLRHARLARLRRAKSEKGVRVSARPPGSRLV